MTSDKVPTRHEFQQYDQSQPFELSPGTQASRALYDEVTPNAVQVNGLSGFICDERGTVATAAHCVSAGNPITVETKAGRFAARIHRIDPVNDIATLKVDWGPVASHMELGTSENLSGGDRIYAFGFPGRTSQAIMSPGTLAYDRINMRTARTNDGRLTGDASNVPMLAADPKMKDQFLDREMRAGFMNVAVGSSGSMVTDNQGKVIGIVGTGSERGAGFTPVEKLQALLNDPTPGYKFDYEAGHQPDWFAQKVNRHLEVLAAPAIGVAGASTLGFGFHPEAQGVPTIGRMGMGLAAIGSAGMLAYDSYKLFNSGSLREGAKYGLSAVADLAMLGSSVAAVLPSFRNASRLTRALGSSTFVAGSLGRLGLEWFPDQPCYNLKGVTKLGD